VKSPLLPNVDTYLTMFDEDRKYVLEHIPELFIKKRQRELVAMEC
jgi:uncharacterized circularly permuted ATP-grasp superfamily protein